jgi:hypothetical protein
MAADTVTVTLSVRLRWWVWPYLRTAQAFLWLMAPFIDDELAQVFVDAVSDTIAQRGLVFMAGGVDGDR